MNSPAVDSNRRKFLKTSVIGAAGVAVGTIAVKDVSAKTAGWSTGMVINANIPNTRVVCCHDPAMVNRICTNNAATNQFTAGSFPWNMTNQNLAANTTTIQNNLDAMAMSLAQKATAAEAWATIFRSSKTWANTKVAIKVNGLGVNHPRVAIVDKLCRVLNTLGVPLASIVIYDGCTSAFDLYDPYVGTELPAGVVVSQGNDSLGGTVDTTIPGRTTNYECTAQIANGTIDILINCAVNKGHGDDFGNCTLSMKNHCGTFTPSGLHDGDSTGYLFGVTKSNAILGGGTPVRQQLVIVDSLYASIPGPGDAPTHTPARLVMGVCSPVVDYQVVKKIREPVMSATHNSSVVNRFCTDFGFSTSNPQWISISPATAVEPIERRGANTVPVGGMAVVLGTQSIPVDLALNAGVSSVTFKLFEIDGRLRAQKVVGRTLGSLPLTVDCTEWMKGGFAGRGKTYILSSTAGGQTARQRVTIR